MRPLYIDDSFKNAISSVFYDKEFIVCTIEELQEADGTAYKAFTVTETVFDGNIFFNNLEKIREDYGIKEEIDYVISTQYDIDTGSIFKYNNQYFNINKALPFDSHNLLVGDLCLLSS